MKNSRACGILRVETLSREEVLFLLHDTLVVYGAIIAGVLVHENTFRGETQLGKSVRRFVSKAEG